jgi:hypothetical protein
MKKCGLLLLFVSSMFIASVHAQTETRFGIQLAPTFSWLTTDYGEIGNNGSNLGFAMAIKADMFFAEKAAFSFGLGLGLNQGGRLLYNNPGDYFVNSPLTNNVLHGLPELTDIRYKVNYIQMPLSLKILTDEILQLRDIRFSVDAPIFTLGIRNKAFADITGLSGVQGFEDNFYKEVVTKDINPLDLSWGFGIGMEYNLSGTSKDGTSLLVGITYGQSIFDITKDDGYRIVDGVNQEENSVATRHNINLMVGMAF